MPVINKKYTKNEVRNRSTFFISKPACVFSFLMCQSDVFSIARLQGICISVVSFGAWKMTDVRSWKIVLLFFPDQRPSETIEMWWNAVVVTSCILCALEHGG
jgi:hypothetical protein